MKPSQIPSNDCVAFTNASLYNHKPSSRHRRLLGRARRANSKSPVSTSSHSRLSSRQQNGVEKRQRNDRSTRLLSYSRRDSSSSDSVSVSCESEETIQERTKTEPELKSGLSIKGNKHHGPIIVHMTTNPKEVCIVPVPVVKTRKTEEFVSK